MSDRPLVGDSPALAAVRRAVDRVAPTDATVLLLGETGTGKELVARLVHDRSPRRGGPFVPVSCAALAPGLIASELFGHEAGAFTGAVRRRAGRFELAAGGTLFLDEVGELPPEAQAALLRVLQERVVERVGGGEPIPVDVRLVAATHRDLAAEAAAGRFRPDQFYRLNVFPVAVPPLRDRPGDVPALAEHFVRLFAAKHGRPVTRVRPQTLADLARHPWPGNVRELQNLIERADHVGAAEAVVRGGGGGRGRGGRVGRVRAGAAEEAGVGAAGQHQAGRRDGRPPADPGFGAARTHTSGIGRTTGPP